MARRVIDRASAGAQKVISVYLGLKPGDDLLIIADENTRKVAMLLQAAATHHGIDSGIFLVPIADQLRCKSSKDLSSPLRNVISGVRAIITCVSDIPEAMKFRKSIIEEGQTSNRIIANCPGLSSRLLATALNVKYEQLVKTCNLVARVLVRGAHAQIITHDCHNAEYKLDMDLDRWNRVPIASTGIITAGLWGNVPSGETYLAPRETTAEGQIVINGSIPGYVFANNEELILTFRSGTMLTPLANENRGALILIKELDKARAAGDLGYANLGELGIGLNPNIRKLTGKPLQDEKKKGTAHIALGDNTHFGGQNKANLHLDLVTTSPTILVDDKAILQDGHLTLKERDWLEDYELVTIPDSIQRRLAQVVSRGNEVDDDAKAGLKRKFINSTGPGNTISVSVGNLRTSRLAARVYQAIPRIDNVQFDQIVKRVKIERQAALKIIYLMKQYELIDLLDNGGHLLTQ